MKHIQAAGCAAGFHAFKLTRPPGGGGQLDKDDHNQVSDVWFLPVLGQDIAGAVVNEDIAGLGKGRGGKFQCGDIKAPLRQIDRIAPRALGNG